MLFIFQKIVKLQHGSKELYFSCIQSARINDNNIIGIPSSYAKVLGIHEYESVFLNDVIRLPLLGQITISPVSFEDYEILVSLRFTYIFFVIVYIL